MSARHLGRPSLWILKLGKISGKSWDFHGLAGYFHGIRVGILLGFSWDVIRFSWDGISMES